MNLLLVVAIGAIVWQGRLQLHQAQLKRRQNLNVALKPVATPPPTPAPKPDAAQPVKYADVATKNLFSKDRNPNVIVDPPKVEVAKPMPPLPVVYGVLGLPSGTRAIMSEKKGADSKHVKSGDMIGEFKIVSLDTKNVVFDWDGKQISKTIDDLIDRSGSTVAQASGPAVAAAPNNNKPPARGPGPAEAGQAERPCIPGDSSPPGTVADGYKKAGVVSPFGLINCRWIAVQ